MARLFSSLRGATALSQRRIALVFSFLSRALVSELSWLVSAADESKPATWGAVISKIRCTSVYCPGIFICRLAWGPETGVGGLRYLAFSLFFFSRAASSSAVEASADSMAFRHFTGTEKERELCARRGRVAWCFLIH